MDPNDYDVLGVPAGASRQEIRRAYLRFIQRLHPDRNPHSDAAFRTARINEAYATLSDPGRRARYDASLNAPGAVAASAARTPSSTPRPAWWTRAAAIAALALCLALAWVIYTATTAPANAGTSASGEPVLSPARARVSRLVDRLSAIVVVRAPVAGTHAEGAAVVTDRVLDRSKFTSRELYDIAEEIHHELGDAAGADPFIAGAYFNARLFATSVELIARINRGDVISDQIAEVRALADSAAVRAWLNESKFAPAYVDLVEQLARHGEQYTPGRPSAELRTDLKSKNAVLEHLRTLIDADALAGRVDSHNARAAVHNQLAEEARLLAQILDERSAIAQQLDLAFNRALDPAMLFGAR